MKREEGNKLFPVFLKLNELLTVIVGGGNVALEKLETLLKNDPDAHVLVIAPLVKEEVKVLAGEAEHVKIIERKVRLNDLKEADMAILATDDYTLHVKIRKWAKKKHLLLNVADTPDLCDFYLGSTVKKGDLKVGISTNGKSPTFAKRFRELLEESLPDETNELLDNLRSFRDKLKGDFSEKVKRLNELTSTLK